MTVAIWPFEAVPVMEQHPSWPLEGHELTLVVPCVQVAPEPAGTVMHSDMSEDMQLRPPPPPLLPPALDDELQAVSLPVKASPTRPASRIPKS